MFTTGLLLAALAAADGLVLAGQTKYGVTVKTADASALAKATTYSWTAGNPSLAKTIHTQITTAIDRELQARGLRKVETGPSDVVVLYRSLSRTDVDLKPKQVQGEVLRDYSVGTLVIDLRDASGRSSLFYVRTDTPIDTDPVKLEAAINAAVTAMFEKYPTTAKR
jgi:hypothetical protein